MTTPSADEPVPRSIYRRARALQRRRPLARCRADRVLLQAAGVLLSEGEHCWLLAGQELVAVVDRQTGLLCSLLSRQPRRRYLLPPTEHGLFCYLWQRDQGAFDIASQPTGHAVAQGAWEGQPYLELSVDLAFPAAFARHTAQVTARYRMLADRLDVCFHYRYLRSDAGQWEAGICQAYHPRGWQRQVFVEVARTTRALRPREKALERYSDLPHDATVRAPDAPLRRARYPYGILEGPDRLLVWGYLDLNSFAVLTPNRLGGLPAFAIAPTGLQQGEGYAFDFTYKVLPKPRYELADACRWYAQHLYSSHALTAGIVRLPGDLPPRVLAEGNVISGFYPPCEVGQESRHSQLEADAARMQGVHLWYGGWHPWNEDRPISGRWYAGGGLWQTAEGVQREIRELRARGLQVYLYFRQIRHDLAYYDDRPPYRDWMHLTEGGFPWTFNFEGLPNPDAPRTPLSPQDRQALGIAEKDYTDVFMDLCHDPCRQWLTQEVMRALDYYLPSGIAWDMGWGDLLEAPCLRHPHTGIHHAVLRLQYDVWRWVKERHPWMRVIGNEFKGSPSQLYCDGIMFEAGDHLDPLTMQSMRCYRTAATGLYYREVFPDQEWPPAVMRHLSYGITFGGRVEDITRPPFDRLRELAAFSARANHTPLVIERQGLRLAPEHERLTGAAWAGPARLLVAIFNDRGRAAHLQATLDRRVLAAYGSPAAAVPSFTVLDGQGLPRLDRTFSARPCGRHLLIAGRLGPREMLLAQQPAPPRQENAPAPR